MHKRRRLRLLSSGTDVEPRPHKVTNVLAQISLVDADTSRAHDESTGRNVLLGANSLDQLAQTVTFRVRLNLSRYTDVFDSWHVDEESSRQGDVRRDARAFLCNRLFRDLDQYLLTFTQQIGNRRLMSLAS